MNLKTIQKIIYTVASMVVAGCATNVVEVEQQSPTKQSPEAQIATVKPVQNTATETAIETSIEADLLFDLLVSSIARQRGEYQVALHSLIRAAYQSADKRIISAAINLATEIGEFQQVADMAKLLNTIEPDKYQVTIALANAQFNLGEGDFALDLLVELAQKQALENGFVYQAIALCLSKQTGDILAAFEAKITTLGNHAGVSFTATLLASMLDRDGDFIRLVEQTLAIDPSWEAAAMLKLTHLFARQAAVVDGAAAVENAAVENNDLDVFATTHLQTYPLHSDFRMQYAQILIQNDELDAALAHLLIQISQASEAASEAVVADAVVADALFTAGAIYIDTNQPKQAKAMLLRYLNLNSHNQDQARLFLADLALQEEQLDLAAKYLNAITSPVQYTEAQIKLARIIAKKDSIEAALRHLAQIDAVGEDQSTRIIIESDLLLRDYDLLEKSMAILSDGLARFPDNTDLLYSRGLLAAQLGLLDIHERDIVKLIALQPENAHAYNALGYTLADKTDRLEEAMTFISKANQLLPDNPFILDSLGWIHFRLGNIDEALKYLRRALDNRADAEIAAHLGEVLWSVGMHKEARKIWNQASAQSPDNAVLKDTIERLSQHKTSGARLLQPSAYDRLQTLPLMLA